MNENRDLDDILQQVYERDNETNINQLDSVLTDAIEYNVKTVRFSGANWYDKIRNERIFVGGAGGISSNLIYLLARLDVAYITVYDPDVVSAENMAGQLYSAESIGMPKVHAIREIARSLAYYHKILAIPELIDDNTAIRTDVVMCGFDNMEARKCLYYKWKNNITENNKNNLLFVDGRLTLDEFQVFCITGSDVYHQEMYEKDYLFSSDQAEPTSCSTKQTAYTAFMIASIMTNLLINFVSNKDEDCVIEKPLPFKTYYNSNTLMLKCYD